jgi:hypothetical protein
VEVAERIWGDQSTTYLRVFAPRIGVTHRGVSHRLNRVLGDFGSERSFARAAAQLGEHYGFEINSSAVRRSTLGSAREASALLEKQYAKDYRLLPAQGADCVVAQADGSMVCTVATGGRSGSRPRQWREMRLTAAQAQGGSTTCYAATLDGVDQVGRRWGHCARQAGRGLESRVHCVADGAEWIRLQSREVFGSKGRFLCDFFHVSEYLGAAATTCRPHNPRQWQKTQQARLKRGAWPLVLKELRPHLEAAELPEEQAPVRCAHRYLNNRRKELDYPGAIAHGLPIGSGLIESGHRHVLQARLKLPGCAWRSDNAELMAQLRVLRANGQWELLWN